MIERIKKKIKTVFINRVLKKVSPTYIAERRIESYVKKNLKTVVNKQEYLFWLSQNNEGESLSDTKKRVFAKLPPAEGVIRDIQKLALVELMEVDKVCKANDINYWIMGGTIIGAVRHSGFIPWDNDVDIGMMRKDYDKLREVLKDSTTLEILEYYNFNGLYRIPKIVIKNSESKLAIDVILFDYVNSSNYDIPKNATKDDVYNIIWAKQAKIRTAYTRRLKLFKLSVLEARNTYLIHDEKKLNKANSITQKYIDKCNFEYDDGDYIIWGVDNFTSRAPDKRRIYKKDAIFPLCTLTFEGKEFTAPADYMDMIVREAGDIWSFPSDIGVPKYYSEDEHKMHLAKGVEALKSVGIPFDIS